MQKQIKIEISIQIVFDTAQACRSTVNALIPDNVEIPEGLLLQVSSLRNTATLNIRSSGRFSSGSTVANTMDEILEHISVASKVVEN